MSRSTIRAGSPLSTTSTSSPTETFVLTDVAAAKLSERLEQEGNAELFLRVAVRPGGCSGFSYEMFFDSELADDDVQSSTDGVKVVIDLASASLLVGASLDYKDGLQGAGFSINNPNATRTCGCGRSFSRHRRGQGAMAGGVAIALRTATGSRMSRCLTRPWYGQGRG